MTSRAPPSISVPVYFDNRRASGAAWLADEETDKPGDETYVDGAQYGGKEGGDTESRYEGGGQAEGNAVDDEVEEAEREHSKR